ncbi:MgtC/SapB family protein [Xanthomonas translucens]|nr:MgtC/SapB family protein [Xanthomonas translucens]WLA04900.1 MgtC/SapB family protein [Xanthomonas translucens]WLA08718.1 MgtC/SapB family protein [Xanthomonas translucens]WLA12452.1 MgtC/SapB family protein [Xanthomonas translucens]
MLLYTSRFQRALHRALRAAVAMRRADILCQLLATHGVRAFAKVLSRFPGRVLADALSLLPSEDRIRVLVRLSRPARRRLRQPARRDAAAGLAAADAGLVVGFGGGAATRVCHASAASCAAPVARHLRRHCDDPSAPPPVHALMEALRLFNLASLLDTLVSLSTAFALGALIGFERQVRQRTAGLRTNTLVAVGAAIFVSLGDRLFEIHGGTQGAVQVVAYVVSGIGFLGAGAIMKEGANVTGLNTAATLWGSGAVGACAGAGLVAEAVLAAVFVLLSNTLLRPVVNRINRRPLEESSIEATYVFYVICARGVHGEVRERLIELLEAAHYPAREVDQHPFGQHDVEIAATLYATAVRAEELDTVIQHLEGEPGVQQAFWNAGAEG